MHHIHGTVSACLMFLYCTLCVLPTTQTGTMAETESWREGKGAPHTVAVGDEIEGHRVVKVSRGRSTDSGHGLFTAACTG